MIKRKLGNNGLEISGLPSMEPVRVLRMQRFLNGWKINITKQKS